MWPLFAEIASVFSLIDFFTLQWIQFSFNFGFFVNAIPAGLERIHKCGCSSQTARSSSF